MVALGDTHDELAAEFCRECRERIMRAASLVEEKHVLNSAELDQIHQEFDTLYGSARAIHLPEMETLFRTMARYARYLRNAQVGADDIEKWSLLQRGITLGLQCDGNQSECIGRCFGLAQPWLAEVEKIMDEGTNK